nr:helix-turn-helix domain-containing protein [Heliobacterium chlorum]
MFVANEVSRVFEDAQKVSSVFADKTRFSIYQFIVNHPNATCTVKDIAQEFSIHPNVARLHLSKLEEIGLLESGWDHQSMPGRPGRIYRLRQKAISLHFPPREYQLLCELTLDALSELGAGALASLEKVGYVHGVRIAQAALATPSRNIPNDSHPLSELQSIESLSVSVVSHDETKTVIRMRNCTFREAAEKYHPLTCSLHRALLRGVWETLYVPVEIEALTCQATGDGSCELCVKPKSCGKTVSA